MGTPYWNTLCEHVKADDGLKVREAGSWTFNKLYWWSEYLYIVTNALAGRKDRWPEDLVYIDLFAGPGVLKSKSDGIRMPGSPLLAANTPKQFRRMIFCELDSESAWACSERLHSSDAGDRSIILNGDCNDLIDEVIEQIIPDSLSLAFIDPTGLQAKFRTLERLATGRTIDLLILFPTEMDIHRNIQTYLSQSHSRLDVVLGSGRWRERLQQLPSWSQQHLCDLMVDEYATQLREELGFSFIDVRTMRNSREQAIYRIMYASRKDLGLKLWEQSTRHFRTGRSLF